MNKRIVCFLLALVMVLGMIPGTVISANAASQLNTSEDARKILEGSLQASFLEEESGNYIGYRTPTNDPDFTEAKNYKDGITKEQALDLMNSFITKVIDKEINDYTKKNNLTLSQGQHDALAVHAYRTNGFDSLKSAVSNGLKGNDLVAAFVDAWAVSVSGGTELNATEKAAMNVALAEAAMYLYGRYDYTGGDKLSYVLLDTDGDMSADKVAGFVVKDGYILPDAGSNSLGWYLYDSKKEDITGSPITKITSKAKMVVSKQQDGGDNMPAKYTIKTNTLADLNVYSYGATPEKTGKILKNKTDFKVTQEYLDAAGIKWVYGSGTDTKDKKVSGWVKLGKVEAAEGEELKPIASATVTTTSLDVYRGATKDSGVIPGEELSKDTNVKIYESKIESTNTGNIRWGKIKLSDGTFGWINLALTIVDETAGESGSVEGKSGKIANTETVNVREEADINSTLLTTLKKGTKVTVLELANGWGYVKWSTPSKGYTQGWIYMDYVLMDDAFEGSSGSGSNGTVKYTGVVTSNINLNVRKDADIYSAKVDSLPNGTKVNIYETKTSRNMKWGRIGTDRWVCLTYVSLTEVEQSDSNGGTATSTTEQATVKPTTLDVYKNYNANSEKVGTLKKGDVVTILEKNTENTGTGTRIWGRFVKGELAGWINLAYTDIKTVTSVTGTTGTTGTATNANGAAGTISNCISVNVRKAAGVYNAQITKLNNGTSVKVYERVTKDNAPWARITWNNGANEGWVCMNYVTMNTQAGGTAADGTIGGTNSNTISATGIVNSNIDLKVRAGAGLDKAQIGSLKKGTKVTVYEQVSADGMIWGRTPYGNGSGWICMSYVTVESTTSTGKGIMGTVARCFAAVNVRSAPGTNNALINKINVGSRVEVFETKEHAGQLWGRVAQGWVCMDYILLDSELPPGTILDATVPTTEATKPGETTKPDDGLNLAGAVSCSISGYVAKDGGLKIYNDADDDSQEVGSIAKGKDVTIVGVKKNGTEVWGIINQNGTQGWINLDNGSCALSGWVNTNEQPIYVSPSASSSVVTELDDGEYVEISKLGTDGSAVYGWIDLKAAWIPVSKLDAKAPELTTYYTSVGTGASLTTAKANSDITAYSGSNSSEAVFKIGKGADILIAAIDFTAGQVWGKVVVDPVTEGWFNMNTTYFTLDIQPLDEITIYTARDESKPMTNKDDETIKITRPAGTAMTVRTLSYDANGNVWAEIILTEAEINNNYIIIRDGDGTDLVSGLKLG